MTSVKQSFGTPGTPWGIAEKEAWAAAQTIQRSYSEIVLKRIDSLNKLDFEVLQYGNLSYSKDYPLFVIKSKDWDEEKPTVLVTGGGGQPYIIN